jgi:hypothetical protein
LLIMRSGNAEDSKRVQFLANTDSTSFRVTFADFH